MVEFPPHKGDGKRFWPVEAKWRSVCRCSQMGSGFSNFLSQGFSAVFHPSRYQSRVAMLYRVELEGSSPSPNSGLGKDPALLQGACPTCGGHLKAISGAWTSRLGRNTDYASQISKKNVNPTTHLHDFQSILTRPALAT